MEHGHTGGGVISKRPLKGHRSHFLTSGPDLGPALTHRAAHVPKLSPLRLRLTRPVRCSGPRGPGTLSLQPPTLDLLSGSGRQGWACDAEESGRG